MEEGGDASEAWDTCSICCLDGLFTLRGSSGGERVKTKEGCSNFLLLLVLTGFGLWNLLVCFIKVRQSTK